MQTPLEQNLVVDDWQQENTLHSHLIGGLHDTRRLCGPLIHCGVRDAE